MPGDIPLSPRNARGDLELLTINHTKADVAIRSR
jgi:hypothetical protein